MFLDGRAAVVVRSGLCGEGCRVLAQCGDKRAATVGCVQQQAGTVNPCGPQALPHYALSASITTVLVALDAGRPAISHRPFARAEKALPFTSALQSSGQSRIKWRRFNS